jgi:hypothetical protein
MGQRKTHHIVIDPTAYVVRRVGLLIRCRMNRAGEHIPVHDGIYAIHMRPNVRRRPRWQQHDAHSSTQQQRQRRKHHFAVPPSPVAIDLMTRYSTAISSAVKFFAMVACIAAAVAANAITAGAAANVVIVCAAALHRAIASAARTLTACVIAASQPAQIAQSAPTARSIRTTQSVRIAQSIRTESAPSHADRPVYAS